MKNNDENSFSRLKRYGGGEIDQKENHATEALAAMLRWLPEIRDEFLRLVGLHHIDGPWVVRTQVKLTTAKQPDLVLEAPNFRAIMEVKVGAEFGENQVANYVPETGKNWAVYVLTREGTFLPDAVKELVAPKNRLSWRQVFDLVEAFAEAENGSMAERQICADFCDYLITEGIVVKFEPRLLSGYAAGFRAQSTLKALFAAVEAELREAKIEITPLGLGTFGWPRLEKRVGPCLVRLRFRVPEIWGWNIEFGHQLDVSIDWENGSQSKAHAQNTCRHLTEKDWQCWVPVDRKKWRPEDNLEQWLTVEGEKSLYRPLFGEHSLEDRPVVRDEWWPKSKFSSDAIMVRESVAILREAILAASHPLSTL